MKEYVYSDYISRESKDVLESYFRKFKREETKQSYLIAFNEFADHLKKDLLSMSLEDCRTYISHMESRRNLKTIRTSTINKKKKQLSSLFTYLAKHREKYQLHDSYYNYFLDIYMEEVGTTYRYERVPEVSHLNDLFLYLKQNDIMTCIAFLLAFKGFLTMDEMRFLSIQDFYEDSEERLVVKAVNPSTPLDLHYNSIPRDVGELLHQYFDLLSTKYPNIPSPYLFSKNGTAVVTQKTLRNRMDKALKKLGLPHYTFNDFRNAGAVYAVAFHADVGLVSNSLGAKSNRHIKKLDSLVVKISDAANYIGIEFKR